MGVGNLLLEHWKRSGPTVNVGVSIQKIDEFEKRNLVALPSDFVEYLTLANGFDQSENHQDNSGFSFWPIECLCRVSEYAEGKWYFKKSEDYFIFCDYLGLSWAYALCVGNEKNGEVWLVGAHDGKPQLIAQSFSEFASLYLENNSALYPI